MSNVKIGDVVVGRRTVGGTRVKGELTRLYRDGQALIVAAESRYTVRADTLFKPMGR